MPRTRNEMVRLKDIFDTFDTDHDGLIPLHHLALILDENNDGPLQAAETRVILKAADKNRDGQLNFDEFAVLMSSSSTAPTPYRRVLYAVADTVTPINHRAGIHSYLSEYNCIPPPLFILLISIAQIGVFVYYALSTPGEAVSWTTGCPGCFENHEPGPLMFAPYLRQQAWRFVSYMMLHAGIQHLLSNIIMQLILGIPLELVHKIWRIAPLYLIGVILGAMVQYTVDSKSFLVGASGGVYALIIAHLANNWSEMPFRWVRTLAVVAFVGFDVGHALYRKFALGQCDAVSYAAHIGGAITGLLLGVVILKNLRILPWEKYLFWISLGIYILVLIGFTVAVIAISPGTERFSCP